MNCMKCGRKIDAEQVFCSDCLADMEKYPIKPGTTVLLPKQDVPSVPRKTHPYFRPSLTPEEQIRLLKKRLRSLSVVLALVLLLFAGMAFFMAEHLRTHSQPLPGQNYSAVSSEESTDKP